MIRLTAKTDGEPYCMLGFYRIPAVLPCHRFIIERMGGVCKEQSYTKRPRLPVMETGGAAVLWETPQALQCLSAAGS